MVYVLLIIGFIFLVKGADWFVDGSSNIAKLLGIPAILVGLTIVAFGTSAPEATVSITAALEGRAEVSVGNVIGSNIFNITLVAGLAAFLHPLKVQNETIKKEIPFTLLASAALLILISDVALQGAKENLLTRGDGLIFLLFLSIFVYYIFAIAFKKDEDRAPAEVPASVTWGKSILFTLIGLASIIFGGNLVVKNGTEIAYTLGMSETLVGLTIIAIGTSLPEFVTSITAAWKKESEIALGNIVGSNIINILFVLGATSFISPLTVSSKVFIDIVILILLTVFLLIFSRTNYKIGKIEGLMLALGYVLYLVYIILRN
jgi:cation:H+ antiporter